MKFAEVRKLIWTGLKTPSEYEKAIKAVSPGLGDEIFVKNYIEDFRKSVVVVSLGIGTGRELPLLDKIKNISKIIGLDYAEAMLRFCQKKSKKCKKEVILIKEDMLQLKKLAGEVNKIKEPIIYLCLENTFGNFIQKEREIFLQKMKSLMKRKDRLIINLYKEPEKAATGTINKIPMFLKIKSKREKAKLAQLIEYPFLPQFWNPIIKKFKVLPRFWYDEKRHDMAVYVGERKVFISHRFSKEEVEKLCEVAKFKIKKLIEGKFMWIVILNICSLKKIL